MRPQRLLTRGEVWRGEFDPVRGHEQAGIRPVIIISTNQFNLNASRLIVVVPVTRADRHNPLHVAISPPDGGLRHRSFALCDMVRSITGDRLIHYMGRVDRDVMDDIADRLRIMLDL